MGRRLAGFQARDNILAVVKPTVLHGHVPISQLPVT
jgi:hypothetical protein